MSSVGWGGGQLAVGLAGQPPAPLMDRAMMGPAQQGQIGQIRRAAMQPMAQMMGLAPDQGPLAAGEHTATVTNRQSGPLGGVHDPAGPADLQRLGRGTPKGRGQQRHRRSQPLRQAFAAVGAVVAVVVGVAMAVGTAGDQDPGHRPITGQPPARLRVQRPTPPTSPPTAWWRPRRLSRSTVTANWGRTPPAWGSRPPARARRANSASASARRWLPLRGS